jgi:hypothetical protein
VTAFESKFKLTSSWKTTNMHCFSTDFTIQTARLGIVSRNSDPRGCHYTRSDVSDCWTRFRRS